MKILVYNSSDQFAIYISSVAVALNKDHNVMLLTQSAKGEMHKDVEKHGLTSVGYNISPRPAFVFYIKHLLYLIKFIKVNKIDVVLSHNHPCNLVAVFAQYFCKARFLICRHHTDIVAIDTNKKAKFVDKIINSLGKEFIVPADKTVDQMVKNEGVEKDKIFKIPYAYDFNDYPPIDENFCKEKRAIYNSELIFIAVGRLIEGKRINELVIQFTNWRKLHPNIKLLILGDGPKTNEVNELIKKYGQEQNILLLGRQPNVLDFISLSDLVIHLSESETSCSVVKEAALCKKPVIVCSDVGDFDEYMKDNNNGFVISKYNYEEHLSGIITKFCKDPSSFKYLGENLYKDVTDRFSIKNIIIEYEKLFDFKRK